MTDSPLRAKGRACAASVGTANLDLATCIIAHADKVIEYLGQ